MKASDLKVVAIILAIALFFTIVTSNAVSIASVVMLAKGGTGTTASADNGGAAGDQQQSTTPSGSGTSTTPSGSGTSTTPSGSGTSTTPSGSGTSTTPSGGTSTTPAGNNDQPAANNDKPAGNDQPADKPADSGNTDKPADSGNTDKPADQPAATNDWDTAKCFNFYKDACDKILSSGSAGHTRKEWQEITSLQLGSGSSGDALLGIIKGFVTSEADAGESISDKGSDQAKSRMAPCGSTLDYVQSATKEDLPNGNYKITIVMKDENTPTKGSAGIASMSTGILYMEDVQDTIQNDKTVSVLVKGLGEGSGIMYRAYTITAEMTKDGKFVDINHVTTGEITANAKLILGSISGNGSLVFHSHWYNFNY